MVSRPDLGGALVGYGDAGPGGAPLPSPPTQTRGAEKRDRIYRAALARFESEGVGATRIEDVIADAGVSWATFFRYFPRKEDVLIEMAARHFRERVRPEAGAGATGGGIEARAAVEQIFTGLLEAAEVSPALHSAALLEVFANPARFAAIVDDGHPQPLVGLVAELLARAQADGELRPGLDPAAAALTVVAGALFPAAQAAALGADPGIAVNGALDLLWEGLGA
jgi:AcrR family transcriptional regulator